MQDYIKPNKLKEALNKPTEELLSKVDCRSIRSFIPPALIDNRCLLAALLAVCQGDYRLRGTNIWKKVTCKLVSNKMCCTTVVTSCGLSGGGGQRTAAME